MAHGDGSVYQRATDGRWCVAVDLPRARGERRRRKVFSATTRRGALEILEGYRRAHPAPEHAGRAEYLARARELGTHTEAEWWALVRSVKRICHYCGITTDVGSDRAHPSHTQRDHVIPVSRGGSDDISNIVVSCLACNQDKGTMTRGEYLAWKGLDS